MSPAKAPKLKGGTPAMQELYEKAAATREKSHSPYSHHKVGAALRLTDGKIYSENGNYKMHLILNGQDYTGVSSLDNNVIKDKDKLLVSFGDESIAQTKQQYDGIPSKAAKFDNSSDPASCSGHQSANFHDRLSSLL